MTPLTYAVMGEQLENAILLVEYGADVAGEVDKGKTALALAVQAGNPEIVQCLFEYANGCADYGVIENFGFSAYPCAAVSQQHTRERKQKCGIDNKNDFGDVNQGFYESNCGVEIALL
ncbi:hypothetical protein DFJ73DRAFT_923043 [Zopfochytrium polystomum]|nr:hypothetical protein DFJ73DRAFT_923043 [Zopfochytrium polystomum]